MARIPLLCPIDALNLGPANQNINATILGNVAQDQDVHIHLLVTFQLTCSNGHTWKATGEFLLERV